MAGCVCVYACVRVFVWGDHLVCVIITHCVRKSICDSPLRQAEIQISGTSLECMFYLTALKSSFLNKQNF